MFSNEGTEEFQKEVKFDGQKALVMLEEKRRKNALLKNLVLVCSNGGKRKRRFMFSDIARN